MIVDLGNPVTFIIIAVIGSILIINNIKFLILKSKVNGIEEVIGKENPESSVKGYSSIRIDDSKKGELLCKRLPELMDTLSCLEYEELVKVFDEMELYINFIIAGKSLANGLNDMQEEFRENSRKIFSQYTELETLCKGIIVSLKRLLISARVSGHFTKKDIRVVENIISIIERVRVPEEVKKDLYS